MPPRITLALLTHNRPQYLRRLAESLKECGVVRRFAGPIEILLLDNASNVSLNDGRKAFERLTKTFPNISFRFLRNERNEGCTRGRQRLAQEASGDILVFIDDDCIFRDPNFFTHIDRLFKELPHLGVLAFPAYEPPTNRVIVAHKKKAYLRKPAFDTYIFWGSLHAIPRKLFQKVGGYGSEITDRGEEYDLACKVIQAGYQIHYTSRLFIIHDPATTGRRPTQEVYINQAINRIVVAWKFFPFRFVISQILMWSLFVIWKTRRLDNLLSMWQSAWGKIRHVKRTPFRGAAREYLRRVDARLWY